MPPSAIEQAVGSWRLRWRRFRQHRAAIASLVVLVLLLAFVLSAFPLQVLLGIDPYATDLLSRFDPPSAQHWLGTDDAGRDVLLRLMIGGQISLLVGVLATAIGGVFGLMLGISSPDISAARLDEFLMRFTDGDDRTAAAAAADRAWRARSDEARASPPSSRAPERPGSGASW